MPERLECEVLRKDCYINTISPFNSDNNMTKKYGVVIQAFCTPRCMDYAIIR